MSENHFNYLIQHKVEFVKLYYHKDSTLNDVANVFHQNNPEVPKPHPSSIMRVIHKFEETGSVENRKKPGRPRTVTSDENSSEVLAKTIVSPIKSTYKLASEAGICQKSVQTILKRHNYHPYKIKLVQHLAEDDFDRRLEFCQWAVEKCDSDPHFSKKILFSDEAIFYLNGHVNRHNMRYWSDSNPHWVSDTNAQGDKRVMVWCGILGDQVIGPYFFDQSVNGSTYLQLLENKIWPQIRHLNQIYFQQDGAPAHYHKEVRAWLDNKMPGRWIGRRGPTEWPPRSPDLTIPDFFLWGYLKSRVYDSRPRTIEDLKNNIIEECKKITPEMLRNSRNSWEMRLKHCIAADGEQFEHLI
jgi:transposase